MKRIYRKVICIDLKSFFASCECVKRNLDPFTTPLVVADTSRGDGAITLAVTPFLRSRGIPSRCRLFEIPEKDNIIIARSNMSYYIEMSAKVVEILLDYVSYEDIYVYSIDENFIDLTNYKYAYEKDIKNIAKEIKDRVKEELKLPSVCGIGDNMLLAKFALDIEGKTNKEGIIYWSYDDVKNKLWNVRPLSKIWGIGNRMEKNFNRMGLFTPGDIANTPLDIIKKRFGIMGEEIYNKCHGIDESILSKEMDEIEKTVCDKSFGHGQTLFKDYYREDIDIIIRELSDKVSKRLRSKFKEGTTIHFSIKSSRGYSCGFSRQLKLPYYTCDSDDIYTVCMDLFDNYYEDYPIRGLGIRVSNLRDIKDDQFQLSFLREEEKVSKKKKLFDTMDNIHEKYGKKAISRGTAYLKDSTYMQRSDYIGGHKA